MQYILPISYLGTIEYYSYILKNQITIEKNDFFVRQSIRNRCIIYSANGPLILSVPRKKEKKSKILIKNTRISYDQNWQKNHWKSIESSYGSSPFFQFYKDKFKTIYSEEEDLLFNFNMKLQKLTLNILEIEKKIHFTNEFKMPSNTIDLRSYNFNSMINEKYQQVFQEKKGFVPNLSIIDLIFNLGPRATGYLEKIDI